MRKSEIHPQAILAASAKIGEGVQIGAYAMVGEEVELGEGCVLHAHAVVQGPSKFGKNNVFVVQRDWRRSAGLYLRRRA